MFNQITDLKTSGNEALQAGKFEDAIQFYTDAIKLDEKSHVLYSNRSAAYSSLREYEKAIEDAEKCIELSPSFVKGYSRKGSALCYQQKYIEAFDAYKKGKFSICKKWG